MTTKKQRRIKNRIIAYGLALTIAYILLVNNSLEFLKNFGISARPEVIGLIGIFVTIFWVAWKSEIGEL